MGRRNQMRWQCVERGQQAPCRKAGKEGDMRARAPHREAPWQQRVRGKAEPSPPSSGEMMPECIEGPVPPAQKNTLGAAQACCVCQANARR